MHSRIRHDPRPPAAGRSTTHSLAQGSALLAIVFMAACASTPAPTSEVAVSAAAVAHAAGAGAPALAPQEMGMARDKLALANAAMATKDYGKARSLAEEAEVDARLAEARTEALKSRKAADDALEANRVLRDEMNRKTPTPQ